MEIHAQAMHRYGNGRRNTASGAGRSAFISGKLLNYRKDHSTFWNDFTISPVRDADGNLTHFVGIIRDITEHKVIEDQVRHSALYLIFNIIYIMRSQT